MHSRRTLSTQRQAIAFARCEVQPVGNSAGQPPNRVFERQERGEQNTVPLCRRAARTFRLVGPLPGDQSRCQRSNVAGVMKKASGRLTGRHKTAT